MMLKPKADMNWAQKLIESCNNTDLRPTFTKQTWGEQNQRFENCSHIKLNNKGLDM